MSVDSDDVIDVAPELESIDTDRIERFIARAELRLSESFYGDLYDEAVTYMTAHLLTVSQRGSSGGAVQSEKVGDLSRTYATADYDGDSLSSTAYGQEVIRIRSGLLVTPIIDT